MRTEAIPQAGCPAQIMLTAELLLFVALSQVSGTMGKCVMNVIALGHPTARSL